MHVRLPSLLRSCASRAESQTFKTLVQFSGSSGAAIGDAPTGSLTLDGTTLYGMTSGIGTGFNGNVFSVGTDGTCYQNLLSFTGTGGAASGRTPLGSLTLNGTSLYGMTRNGGANGHGNVFSVSADGTNYQNLLEFTGSGGSATGDQPYGKLTLDGTTLYGTTMAGGYYGNIFSVGIAGTNYRNLVNFTSSAGTATGLYPLDSLTLSGTTLYGITTYGGSSGYGNVFSVATDGTNFRNLLSFTGTGGGTTGNAPIGSPILSGSTLYGMTEYGGTMGVGNIYSIATDGTNYKNLLTFTGSGGSGQYPSGGLILSGTTLYGRTFEGGPNSAGNIFSVGIDGSDFQDLYSFTGGTDGGFPDGELTLSGGTLFGMTSAGGSAVGVFGNGTIFALVLPTPEPCTLALAGSAAAALVSYRWRRRRSR